MISRCSGVSIWIYYNWATQLKTLRIFMVWWPSIRWYTASLDSERGDCHLKLVSTPTGKLSYQEKDTSLEATGITFRTMWYASTAASIFFFFFVWKAETWSCHWAKNHTRRFLRTDVYSKFWCSTLCTRTCLCTWWMTSSRYYKSTFSTRFWSQ